MKPVARSCALMVVFAAGCAPKAPGVSVPRTPASTPAAASKPSAEQWHAAVLPLDGVAIEMPRPAVEVEEIWRSEKDRKLLFRGLSCKDCRDGTGYRAGAVGLIGKDHLALATDALDEVELMFNRVDTSRPITQGGVEGYAMEAHLEGGQKVLLRVFPFGTILYLARADVKADGSDRQKAERFLGSLRITHPWRLHASVEGRFTVSVPVAAQYIEQDTPAELPGLSGGPVQRMKMSLFHFGNARQVAYGVAFGRLDVSDPGPALVEDILQGTVSLLAEKEMIIHKFKPIELDGAPGREITATTEDGKSTRMKTYVAGSTFYVVMTIASDASALQTPEASRFFDSFRFGSTD